MAFTDSTVHSLPFTAHAVVTESATKKLLYPRYFRRLTDPPVISGLCRPLKEFLIVTVKKRLMLSSFYTDANGCVRFSQLPTAICAAR